MSIFDEVCNCSEENLINPQEICLTKEEFYSIQDAQELQLSSTILKQGFLSRQKKLQADAKWIQHYCILYTDRLVLYDENRSEIQGIMNLIGVKLELEQFNVMGSEELFLVFSSNLKVEMFFTADLEIYEAWVTQLSKVCILTDFGKYYQPMAKLGSGTFAKVILAKNIQTNKEYAVKVYDTQKILSSDDTKVRKTISALKQEIQIMRKISHPNIIQLYEIYEGENHVYLVQDLLTGGELYEKLTEINMIPEQEAREYIKPLLSALAYLQTKGIMHRDIKPENLILKNEKSNELVLVDFGLSEFENNKTPLFTRCGTPGYVAPEILKDQTQNCKIDIFSLGVILFTLMAEASPFYNSDYQQVIKMNKKCQIDWDLIENRSKQVQDLLKNMLSANPEERFNAVQCLNHPWIQNDIESNENIPESEENLNFSVQSKMARLTTKKFSFKAKKSSFSKGNDQNQNSITQLKTNTPLMRGRIESQGTYVLESPFNSSKTINLRKNALKSMRQNSYAKQVFQNVSLKESKFSQK